MSGSEESQADFTEVGKRPYVKEYVEKPTLHVGDRVYLLHTDGSRKGPYLVSSFPSTGKYTLSLESGSVINDGAEVDTVDVEAA